MKSILFATALRRASVAVTALAMFAIINPAHADELVTNGSFSSTTGGDFGQLNFNGFSVDGWSNTNTAIGNLGYNLLFNAGTADTTGSSSSLGAPIKLWGPNLGSDNGLPASSPDGGNFLALDPAFNDAAITQTINGLTVGQQYDLSFYYAGAQQFGFDGPTSEGFVATIGSSVFLAPILSNDSHGFTGWQHEDFQFTATGTSEVLSFLADGTPDGLPPFALLDGVSIQTSPTPEPSSLALLLTGFAGVGGVVRNRFKKSAV